jgi:hypothetical protein
MIAHCVLARSKLAYFDKTYATNLSYTQEYVADQNGLK